MSFMAQWLRTLADWVILPFDYPGGVVGLTVFSVLSGVGMLWVMGKTTNQAGMEQARERMLASVYEIRLFLDSPRRVLSAQGQLFLWNARYIGHMLPAFVILLPPLVLMYMPLDIRYGWEPLPIGESVMIVVDIEEGADGQLLEVAVDESSGVRITSPLLYAPDERKVYLRGEVSREAGNTLALRMGDSLVTKELWGASDRSFVSPECASGFAHLWAIGMEEPIADGSGIAAIVVEHEPRMMNVVGIPMPWWVYWLVVSVIAALAMRKPMGVVL